MSYELIGWPFPDPPLEYGVVHTIPWAVASNGNPVLPAINGYARIPWEGHPWSGCTDYDDLPVQVHGGLTYGPRPPIELAGFPTRHGVTFRDTGGWVGFDTSHGSDVWTTEALAEFGITFDDDLPAAELRLLRDDLRSYVSDLGGVRWTRNMVIAEAMSLAEQISQAMPTER